MDLSLLTSDSVKPWLNIRVNELKVDTPVQLGTGPSAFTLPDEAGAVGEVLKMVDPSTADWAPASSLFDQSLNTTDDVEFASVEVNHVGDAEMVMAYAPGEAFVYEGAMTGADIYHRVGMVDTLVARFNELGSEVHSDLLVDGATSVGSLEVNPGVTSYTLPADRSLVGNQTLVSDGLGGVTWDYYPTVRGGFQLNDYALTTVINNGGVGTWNPITGPAPFNENWVSGLDQAVPFIISTLGETRLYNVNVTMGVRADGPLDSNYEFGIFVNGSLDPGTSCSSLVPSNINTGPSVASICGIIQIPVGGSMEIRARNITDAQNLELWSVTMSLVSM